MRVSNLRRSLALSLACGFLAPPGWLPLGMHQDGHCSRFDPIQISLDNS